MIRKNMIRKNMIRKNMIRKNMIALLASASLVAACTNQDGRPYNIGGVDINKETVGGVAGAAIGAVAGSNVGKGRGRIAAIAIGTLLGAKLGASVGESLDKADMAHYNRTSQHALERGQVNQEFPWNNPNSGNSGTVTPQGYYQRADGTYCREYTQTINVGGRIEEAYGTACRQADGTWRIADAA